jgi:LCP family protein required for cell wall assembly
MKYHLLVLTLILSLPVTIYGQTVPLQTPAANNAPVVKQWPPLIKTNAALGISAKTRMRLKNMTDPPVNIALFAVDKRTAEDAGNSDVIMIISIDQTTGKIKMSSIMRDTYVKIDGKGMDKINAAYATGGPQLAIKTINQNFDMDIKDYMNVDFYSAAKIVDALDGVQVNVKPNEIQYLNHFLDELAIYDKTPPVYVKEPGLQKLNGKQAVAYTRIRYAGNGDYERTERQRNVLIALFGKLKASGQNAFPIFSKTILPNIETSMSDMELINFAGGIFYSKSKTIEQSRFPLDEQGHGKRINNIWYLVTDLNAATTSLHQFIYGNSTVAPKKL